MFPPTLASLGDTSLGCDGKGQQAGCGDLGRHFLGNNTWVMRRLIQVTMVIMTAQAASKAVRRVSISSEDFLRLEYVYFYLLKDILRR